VQREKGETARYGGNDGHLERKEQRDMSSHINNRFEAVLRGVGEKGSLMSFSKKKRGSTREGRQKKAGSHPRKEEH